MTGSGGKTNKERGLGWSHQKRRAYLLRTLIPGSPCDLCNLPMYKSQDLDADHTIPRSQGGTMADRLVHRACNRSRGDGTRGQGNSTEPVFYPTVTSRDW